MMDPHCKDCGESYPEARRNLGYKTCLACGDKEARSVQWLTAPINKGAYQVINKEELKQLNPKRSG